MKKNFIIATFLILLVQSVWASSKVEIDAAVKETILNFQKQTSAGYELSQKATGILVFPNIIKAGFGIGGEYGEGVLLIDGVAKGYYNLTSASIGFQIGVQSRSQIILFMDKKSLSDFTNTDNFRAGIDASVAVASLSSSGSIDSESLNKPIIGFIFSGKGLMYNLTFEGSRISKIEK
jgi:lipid-binding SYLF domain-containing protein